MRAVDEDEEDNFPVKYLQQSSGPGLEPAQLSSSVNQLEDSVPNARWEDRLSDLARVESILKKRMAELQEVEAVLIESRRQLDDAVQKRKIADGRLKRAEEDAGIIEQRAAETSVELIRAGNQLINLEIKEKALMQKQDHIDKTLQARTQELREVENSCEVVRRNVDKLNMDLRQKTEELEYKESQLRDVESRIKLSLRVEELKQLVVQTEKEEKNKEEKYVRALKEGEKALEEKTLLLARTRNEIQTQMTEFHELNSKINKMRTELKEVQANIRKGKNEVVILSEKREEERRTRELDVKEAEEKLVEINSARNESMDALKRHREELSLLRRRIHDSMNKLKECEELKKQKEAEYKETLALMNEAKVKLENDLSRLKSETQTAEESLRQISGDLNRVTTELDTAREELLASKVAKDSLTAELKELQQVVTEKRDELKKTNQEIESASEELKKGNENIAEIQARHDELLAEMKKECDNKEDSRIDSLPQESSTPRSKEKDYEAIVSGLQGSIKHLTAANEEKHVALEDANAEIKELEEFMESERKNFQEYLVQVASESEVYRKHIEKLQMEYAAEKQRHSRKKDLLLHKAEEHRLKARKLSEELSKLQQNHLQTKHELNQLRDTLAKDVKELKEHIEGITIQMKSEMARRLKQVETSKEQTSEEIEQLREKEDEMEVQLAVMQQSINTAKQMAFIAGKEKAEVSKREKEESLRKEQGVKLQRQQINLRAQLRQQMSTRAEALDEERKKAEVSLEGLKNKLKNLEEVISRKDSSVEDFRLKLLRSKVEAEKAADSNKQIDELKRRLRELENEKDLIKSQRNHLVTLNEGASLDRITLECGNLIGALNGSKTRTTSSRLRRSLDSLTEDSFYTEPVKLDLELPCRDEGNLNTSLPLEIHRSASLGIKHEPIPSQFLSASRDVRKLKKASNREVDQRTRDNLPNTAASQSKEKSSFKAVEATLGNSTRQNSIFKSNSSTRMSREELSADNSDGLVFHSTSPTELQTEESVLTVSGRASDTRFGLAQGGKEKHVGESATRPSQGSASSFADDRKNEFFCSVHRLKNEKVRELELSLQRLFFT